MIFDVKRHHMIFDEQLSTMSIAALRELQEKLSQRIQALTSEEKQKAVKKVHELIAAYGIGPKEVFGRASYRASSDPSQPKRKVEPKYRDPETGMTWTGRGKAPKWLSGKNRDDFRITITAE